MCVKNVCQTIKKPIKSILDDETEQIKQIETPVKKPGNKHKTLE